MDTTDGLTQAIKAMLESEISDDTSIKAVYPRDKVADVVVEMKKLENENVRHHEGLNTEIKLKSETETK
jgi:hypothetical protein